MKVITKIEIYADRVLKRIADKKKRVLFAQGKYLRTTMQRSMRWSKKPSAPGQPPHAHRNTGGLLRKLILFKVDLDAGSVVCGPKLSKSKSTTPLPQLLNEGGDVTKQNKGKRVTTDIAPRPFTQPVFSDGGTKFRQLIEQEAL